MKKAIGRFEPKSHVSACHRPFEAASILESSLFGQPGFTGLRVDGEEYHVFSEHWSLTSHWNGEGLPPVGVECEINHVGEFDSKGKCWRRVVILAHHEDERLQSPVAIYMPLDGTASCDQAIAICFRPVRTPEQIADEERKDACEQMCIDAGGSVCDAQMAKAYMLYDQGYRKQSDA